MAFGNICHKSKNFEKRNILNNCKIMSEKVFLLNVKEFVTEMVPSTSIGDSDVLIITGGGFGKL